MRGYVLDASALLALLKQEEGSERIADFIAQGAAISSVNVSEVVAKLSDAGMPEKSIHAALDLLSLMIVDLDIALAYDAGLLRPLTRHLGLSLGDRVCLALAKHLNLPAVTTDHVWERLTLGITVQVIR